MNYQVNASGDTTVVALDGQLNFAANEAFETLLEHLVKLKSPKVVFDMAELSHIDSVGLGLLFIAQEDLSNSGMQLTLRGPRGSVARLLVLTEADKTFQIIT